MCFLQLHSGQSLCVRVYTDVCTNTGGLFSYRQASTAEIVERVPMVESNLLNVKSMFEEFTAPPVRNEANQPPACASTNDCPAPTLEAGGDGSMMLVAKNGPIKFDCPGCNGTDVGKIVRDLDALLAKFGDGH